MRKWILNDNGRGPRGVISLNPKLFFGFSWWRGDYVFVPSAKMLFFLRQKRKETGNDSADSPASRKSKTHEFGVICVYIAARLFAREVNAFSAAFSLFLLLLGDLTFSSFCCIFSISLKKACSISRNKSCGNEKYDIQSAKGSVVRNSKFDFFPPCSLRLVLSFPRGLNRQARNCMQLFSLLRSSKMHPP